MIKPTEDSITVGDFSVAGKLPFQIKVYKVRIETTRNSQIWYVTKKGREFYCVLSVKEISEGFSPVFRVIKISASRNYVSAPVLVQDIHPSDCRIVEEFLVRTDHSLRSVTVSLRPTIGGKE